MDKATATEIHSRSPDAQHFHPNAFYFSKCARHASSVRSAFPRFALSAHIGITGIHIHFKSPRDVPRHTKPMRLVQGSCSSPRDPASVATFVMLHHAH